MLDLPRHITLHLKRAWTTSCALQARWACRCVLKLGWACQHALKLRWAYGHAPALWQARAGRPHCRQAGAHRAHCSSRGTAIQPDTTSTRATAKFWLSQNCACKPAGDARCSLCSTYIRLRSSLTYSSNSGST